MMNNILTLKSWEQMELYKKETGATKIEMFSFNYWLFLKSLETE